MPLIFISHSVADKPIVDGLFDLLQMGCSLTAEDIFCSSVEGASIKTGEDFVDWIYDKLYASKLVILVVTPNYFASRFCVAEMGAAWALKKKIFPLVLPDMERDPGAVLLGKQTAVIEPSGLDELRDSIVEVHPTAGRSTPRWSIKKEEFLNKFIHELPHLPKPPVVHQDVLKEEQDKSAAAIEMYQQVNSEKELLIKQLHELEKAKDADEVKKIKSKYTPKDERYEALVEEVQKQLGNLTDVEVRCVYSAINNDPWEPEHETWNVDRTTINRAIESEWINWESAPSQGQDGLIANRNHPRMKPVFQAIKELKHCIDVELGPDIIEALEKKHQCYISVTNRQYWVDVLYERILLD